MTTNDHLAARRCLSVSEAGHALGVCRSSVNKMIRSGELPSVKLGSRRLIPAGAIDSLIARKLEAGKALDQLESEIAEAQELRKKTLRTPLTVDEAKAQARKLAAA